MTFNEFLKASDESNLADYLASIDSFERIPAPLFDRLIEKMKAYVVVGGLPEAVRVWTETRDTHETQTVLYVILELYRRDFQKHAERSQFPKIERVWNSLPSQLSRENKKFLYSLVKDGARAREYEDAAQWLASADIVSRVFRAAEPGLPVSAYDDLSAFKLYLLDVGLLRRHSLLAPTAFAEGNRLFTEFRGALSENYVLQSLRPQFEAMPRYWTQEKPRYEVDFLVQYENDIIPIEVKSGEAVHSSGLKHYRRKYGKSTKIAVRFSLKNLTLDDGLLNLPLFLAGETKRLLGLAYAQ
jgi:predicted AAA+ superfamily ATPase